MDTPVIRLREFLIAWLALGLWACHREAPPIQSVAAHDALLSILTEFRRHSETDLYRFPMPEDMSGLNIFRVTIQRLDFYQQNHPEQNTDIAAYTRGEAYARLGAFKQALVEFRKVLHEEDSPLREKAGERIEIFSEIATAISRQDAPKRLAEYLEFLDLQSKNLKRLRLKIPDGPENYFVLREMERVSVEKAIVLFRNRFVIRDGALRGINLLDEIIDQHPSSRLIYRHHLMLGRYQYELAQDLAIANPADGLQFDIELFEKLLTAARSEFLRVAQADGYQEKFEAAALLDAIEAFGHKVRSLAR